MLSGLIIIIIIIITLNIVNKSKSIFKSHGAIKK